MINRVIDKGPRIRHDLAGGIIGVVVGLLVGAAVTFAVAVPDTEGVTSDREVCIAAAERWAQIDATWSKFTVEGTTGLSQDEVGVLDRAREAAHRYLEGCRDGL
jgi:hypothetical protein